MTKGKRVSNKPQGEPGARQFQCYQVGYHRQRKLDHYAELRKKARKDLLEGTSNGEPNVIKKTIKSLSQEIRSLLPKALLRRHQGR